MLHDLRNKLMRVEQLAVHRNEQTACFRLARIMNHVFDRRISVSTQGSARYPCHVIQCNVTASLFNHQL
jgi:hypothetical protein